MTIRLKSIPALAALVFVGSFWAGCIDDLEAPSEFDAAVHDASNDVSEEDVSDVSAGCNVDADCDENWVCRLNECVFDGCVARVACEEYCHQKVGRCINEECGGDQDVYEVETAACIYGVSDGPVAIPGCMDRATVSQQACEEVEAETEDYVDQDCAGEEQERWRCKELISYRFLERETAEQAFEACGCEPPQVATACNNDDDNFDCAGNDPPVCLTSGERSEGICTTFCDRLPGMSGGASWRDVACGENGSCAVFAGVEQGVCQRHCVSLDDCTENTYCVPYSGTRDESGQITWVGVCDDGSMYGGDPPFEYCRGDADCAGGRCREGTCQPACEDDGDCSHDGDCVEETDGSYCDIRWADELR